MDAEEKHPIAAGLVALVGVGLAVGLVLGLVTLAFSQLVGIGGGGGSGTADGGPSLYLPTPVPTTRDSSSQASPGPDTATGTVSPSPAEPTETTSSPAHEITLQAGETSVAPMDRIDLTGVYPGGDGAVLQVQRKEDGSWQDFPVTTAVSGETFSTYVQTGRSGVQKFRVKDTDSGKVSNVVSVTVG